MFISLDKLFPKRYEKMNVLVVFKPSTSCYEEIVNKIIDCFSKDNVKAVEVSCVAEQESSAAIEFADICIAIGGDGTTLRTVREVAKYNKPIFSVNAGNLGFLSEVAPAEIDIALDKIKNNDYSIQKRIMLKGYIKGKPENEILALNELLVHTKKVGSILRTKINISGVCLGKLSADGVMVATPTGSTAYSLSAGGPLVHPTSAVIGLIPVCPHALSFRPLIAHDHERIEIECLDDAELIADSAEHWVMATGDSVVIEKADVEANFIDLHNSTFYDKLREKLRWGGMNN